MDKKLRSEEFVKIKKNRGLGSGGCQAGSEQRNEREGGQVICVN